MVARSVGAVVLAALTQAAACGTDAVGVQTCRAIEEARCQQAPACNISLQPPYRTSGSDVSACIRFYDEACLHGLANGSDPGTIEATQCVAAIRNNGCAVVLHPETDPSCAWLSPDASAATPTADAAAEHAE
jgi:hypothetical protein